MPRTKRAKTASKLTKERDTAMKTFEKHMQLRIAKMERDSQLNLKSFEAFVNVKVSCLPAEIRQMTLGDLINWRTHDDQKENDEVSSTVRNRHHMHPPAVSKVRKTTKKRATTTTTTTAASDDGYATEGTSMGSTSLAAARAQAPDRIRTRSFVRTSNLGEINQKTLTVNSSGKGHPRKSLLKSNNFLTPAVLKPSDMVYSVITPKVKPNTPLNVLRRPRQGEMALSMQGSPLLVSAVIEEKTANINVPLADGKVMSLLPQEGLRMSNIPPLDAETMHQLKTLKNHIEKVISLK